MTTSPKPSRKPRAKKAPEAVVETPVENTHGGAREGAGRNTLPRANVWERLKELKYEVIDELVDQANEKDCDPKIRMKINLDLLSYIAPKCKTEIKIGVDEDDNNALAAIFAGIAQAGRPKPPTEDDK